MLLCGFRRDIWTPLASDTTRRRADLRRAVAFPGLRGDYFNGRYTSVIMSASRTPGPTLM
jgi:hypothetical protein